MYHNSGSFQWSVCDHCHNFYYRHQLLSMVRSSHTEFHQQIKTRYCLNPQCYARAMEELETNLADVIGHKATYPSASMCEVEGCNRIDHPANFEVILIKYFDSSGYMQMWPSIEGSTLRYFLMEHCANDYCRYQAWKEVWEHTAHQETPVAWFQQQPPASFAIAHQPTQLLQQGW